MIGKVVTVDKRKRIINDTHRIVKVFLRFVNLMESSVEAER